jgi:hypothetical protein
VSTCHHCGKPLEYSGSGRRRRYCSDACKQRAARRRKRFIAPFRNAVAPLRNAGSARNEKLARALAEVKRCERELAGALATRAALDAQPDPLEQPHRFATYGAVEELHAAQGGAVLNPGIDVGEAARAIRRRVAGEPN